MDITAILRKAFILKLSLAARGDVAPQLTRLSDSWSPIYIATSVNMTSSPNHVQSLTKNAKKLKLITVQWQRIIQRRLPALAASG